MSKADKIDALIADLPELTTEEEIRAHKVYVVIGLIFSRRGNRLPCSPIEDVSEEGKASLLLKFFLRYKKEVVRRHLVNYANVAELEFAESMAKLLESNTSSQNDKDMSR